MTRSKRVVHLLASNFFGGPEKQLVEHAQRIAKKNIQPLIISFMESNATNQLLERAQTVGVATRALSSSGPLDFSLIGKVLDVLRTEKIDLLCVHGYKANVIGRLASWRAGIPLIAISRGWTGEDAKIRVYEWLDKFFLRLSDHIVAVSAKQQQRVTNIGIPIEKVTVIRNCINVGERIESTDSFRTEMGLDKNSILVISAGRLSPEKNYSGMVDAAKIVCEENSNVYFAVFGEGVLRTELENKIASFGLSKRFFLPGFRVGMQVLLQEIDIFVLPSFTEGLPNVILEAFAAGKPVVATAVGGTPEVVEDGVSGFLTDPQKPEYMAECILKLVENENLRKTMGESGLESVKKNYTFEHQTDQYEKLYIRFIKNSGL
ncbi:MAG: glycosyltransferase [Geobacteraceae bacterium]|nr:glycosyltransferase [Geobacteraceae bacterium]